MQTRIFFIFILFGKIESAKYFACHFIMSKSRVDPENLQVNIIKKKQILHKLLSMTTRFCGFISCDKVFVIRKLQSPLNSQCAK